jgi:hypothetical protein
MLEMFKQEYGKEVTVYQEHMFLSGVNGFSKGRDKVMLDSRPGYPTSKSDENVEEMRTLVQNDRHLYCQNY